MKRRRYSAARVRWQGHQVKATVTDFGLGSEWADSRDCSDYWDSLDR